MTTKNLGAAFEKFKADADIFPQNPFALERIKRQLQELKDGSLLAIAVRDAAKIDDLTGALKLVMQCVTDNPRIAIETFGAELVKEIKEFVRAAKKEQRQQETTTDNYAFGLYGYMGDN